MVHNEIKSMDDEINIAGAIETILKVVLEMQRDIAKVSTFIMEMKNDFEVLEDKIELNSMDVMKLLSVSKATLGRWRATRAIPYRYISSNHVVYPLKGLYIAIKTGRATFKGFPKVEALERLESYKHNALKSYMGEDTEDFAI